MSGRWRHLYASHKWRKSSEAFRKTPESALCVDCKSQGRIAPSEHVDHTVPHEGNLELFWDPNNWAGRCHSCHSAKTLDDKYQKRTARSGRGRAAMSMGEPLDRNSHWWK